MRNREWNRVHFSSLSEEWETPDDVFAWANQKWGPLFLDVCATAENAKCQRFYTKEEDAFTRSWDVPFWVNPPYGRGIAKWIRTARGQAVYHSVTGVCLLPARVDTKWFHEECVHGEVYFLKGRLKFSGSKNSAPFPSMIVVFK